MAIRCKKRLRFDKKTKQNNTTAAGGVLYFRSPSRYTGSQFIVNTARNNNAYDYGYVVHVV